MNETVSLGGRSVRGFALGDASGGQLFPPKLVSAAYGSMIGGVVGGAAGYLAGWPVYPSIGTGAAVGILAGVILG